MDDRRSALGLGNWVSGQAISNRCAARFLIDIPLWWVGAFSESLSPGLLIGHCSIPEQKRSQVPPPQPLASLRQNSLFNHISAAKNLLLAAERYQILRSVALLSE